MTEGALAGTWSVRVEQVPQVKGGHCVVEVRESDGAAKLFYGE
jgi:hypothetical protein